MNHEQQRQIIKAMYEQYRFILAEIAFPGYVSTTAIYYWLKAIKALGTENGKWTADGEDIWESVSTVFYLLSTGGGDHTMIDMKNNAEIVYVYIKAMDSEDDE